MFIYNLLHIAPLGQRKRRGYIIYFFYICYNHYAPDGALKEIFIFIDVFG